MKAFAGICGMLLLALTTSDASASGVFDGNLVNEEVVPLAGQAPPVTNGGYEAALAIRWDDATNIGCGHFVWSGLSGKPTALHVHIGASGANTTTRYSVPVPAGDTADGDVFFRIQGNAAFGAAIASQGVYGDIHTVKFASGEVRAQLDLDEGNDVECPDSVPLGLDGTVTDAGAPDASTPATTSSSTSSASSSSSSSGADDNDGVRTAPDVGTETTSKSAGGCHTGPGPANLSALLVVALGLVALKRKRR